jgi:polar amino acid transport system substrate-binding protein
MNKATIWQACLLAALVAGHGLAQSACSRPITIAISGQGSEFVVDEKRAVSGAMAEVLDEVTRRSGCTFDFVFVPRVRAIGMFLAGEIDVLPAAVQTQERDRAGVFVAYSSAQVAAIGLRKRLVEIGTPDDALSGSYLVNVVRGHDYGPAFKELLGQLKAQRRLEEVVDPLTAARKLAIGRADVVLIVPAAFGEAAERAGIDNSLQAVPIATIPPFLAGIYLSRSSLGTLDRNVLVAAMSDLAVKQRYWNAMSKRLRPWAQAGARPVH